MVQTLKKNLVLVVSLTLLGTGVMLTAVQASSSGWGVDNAPPEEKRGRSAHNRRHGHFFIFYGARHRNVRGGGGFGGGGFRGGK